MDDITLVLKNEEGTEFRPRLVVNDHDVQINRAKWWYDQATSTWLIQYEVRDEDIYGA